MTYSQTLTTTNTETFTIADAKYLASRIASDLTQVRVIYGQYAPNLTAQKVQDFAVEAAVLLKFKLLEYVRYGFTKDDKWVYYLSYEVNELGQLVGANDGPGDIDPTINLAGASWYSYLTTRPNPNISSTERQSINDALPINRATADEPSSGDGYVTNDKSYYRNGVGLSRNQFRSY